MAHGDTIQFYHGPQANVAGNSAPLADGEPMWATDAHVLYVVQGAAAYEVGGFRGAYATNASNQTVATATWASLTFSAENFDTDSFHDAVTNTSRMTVPAGLGGYYDLFFSAHWSASMTAPQMRVLKNGSGTPWTFTFDTCKAMWQATALILSAGDYVEVQVQQTSGSNQTITDAEFRFERRGG